MKKLIVPALALAFAICAFSAEASNTGLALARANLYKAKMRAYNAQIKHYQSASLHYLKKMPALTMMKYASKLPSSYKYKLPSVAKNYPVKGIKLTMPNALTIKKAVNARNASQLMSALKRWGR